MSDLIGFVISILALIYIMFKQAKGRGSSDMEEGQPASDKREQALHEFLKSLEGDLEEEEEHPKRLPPKPVIPPPPKPQPKPKIQRTVSDDFHFKTDIKDFKTDIEHRNLMIDIGQAQFDEYGNKVVSADLQMQGQQAYRIISTVEKSRLKSLLQTLPSKRDMLIYQEVMGRPKALRQSIDSYDYP